jgi:hypothetical protein
VVLTENAVESGFALNQEAPGSVASGENAAGVHASSRTPSGDTLVSLLLIASGDPAADLGETRRLAEQAAARYEFHEIVVAVSRPSPAWRAAMLAEAGQLPRLRIVTIDIAMDYEELLIAALRFPIGDVVACLWPGEARPEELDRLLEAALTGRADIVRGVWAQRSLSRRGRWSAALLRRAGRLVTGRDVAEYPARAIALTRAALNRLDSLGGSLRFFRVLDLSGQFQEAQVELVGSPRRGLLDMPGERVRLVALLVSASAPRVVLGFALVCLALSLGSAAYTAYALLAWVLLPQVADGWTSTSVVFSLLFCANFAVLSALCLGLLELLRRNVRDPVAALATETGSGDRFGIGGRLNVEPADAPEATR